MKNLDPLIRDISRHNNEEDTLLAVGSLLRHLYDESGDTKFIDVARIVEDKEEMIELIS